MWLPIVYFEMVGGTEGANYPCSKCLFHCYKRLGFNPALTLIFNQISTYVDLEKKKRKKQKKHMVVGILNIVLRQGKL